jgi:carbonic anhydrase/acetyltransferase-like protein (isoleucine patch superfamily)
MHQSPIILPYKGIMPQIHPSAFLAPGVMVIGDVHIGKESNIWPGCVIRGDVHRIRIGARTNLQDGTIVHVTRGTGPTEIGSGITVGHACVLHACTLEDDAFIGMRATLMDGALVKSGGMVAAGALLAPGKTVPGGEIWAGSPARLFRPMSEAEKAFIRVSAQNYVDLARDYKA